MVNPRHTGLKPLSSFSFFFVLLVVVLFSLFESTFQQQNSTAPLSSRLELLALYGLRSSLGLRARDWPLKVDPCRSWNGLRCENGRVVGISVSGLRRTRIGRDNPRFEVNALGNLTLLKSFNASGFALPGSIPDLFGQRLVSLEVIDLRSCSVLGSIPSGLGNLTNLTGLYLSRNNLNGSIPFSLGNLPSLSTLDLSHNSLSGSIPSTISNLRNASLLDLSWNSLLGPIPPGIGTLSGLRTLNLSNNNLSSQIPAQLGDLGALVDLDLGGNSLTGLIPPELRGLRSLKRMLLGDNLLGGPLPNDLFVVQTQLEVLVLKQNSFAGDFPVRVWTIPGLTFLDISGNNFTGQLPNSSSNGNNSNSVLNISGNLFYGGLTPAIVSFVSVDLSGNYFQGTVPSYVTLNTSLVQNCLRNSPNQRTLSDCEAFYSARGLDFDNFLVPTPSPQPSLTAAKKSGRRRQKLAIILGAVLGGAGLIAVIAIAAVLCMCCGAKRASSLNTRGVGSGVGPVPPSSSPPPGVSVFSSSIGDAFTYQQILQATGDFGEANLVKKGHSGDLYRGILESGVPVVVKRVDLRSVKKEAYTVELDFFTRVSHSRFVPFLGHCLENEDEKYMVYKYMPNGDLSSSLFKKSKTEEDSLQSLDWITRLKIALGAAEGLSYLHHECNPPLVHRDVQASSILLDDKFEVRLGSLSEVCAQEGDTHQSKITRLLRLPQSSEQGSSGTLAAACAYDVYCFGKVLLELVTGRLGISSSSEGQTKEWLDQTLPHINIYEKELMTKILDPSLIVDEDLLEEVWAMAVVARSCLNPKPSRRPPMRYILKALENPLKVVREENSGGGGGGGGSARLRTTSSRGSWNAALFGSWRSSSDVTVILPGSNSAAATAKAEGGLKRSGTSGSQASGGGGGGATHNGGSGGATHNGGGGEHSSSHRRNSREIFPEPSSD